MGSGLKEYHEKILAEVRRARSEARKARDKYLDPSPEVEIPLAEDIAARVESLVGTMQPKLIGSGVQERIRELEDKYSKNDERVAFEIAKDVSENKFVKFKTKEEQIEGGLRIGVAYLTLGIVTAPLEGITKVKIKARRDGGDYLSVFFSGPIRSAGGTAAAMSVLLADYLRRVFDVGEWDPTDKEVERYVVEVDDYDHVTNLQYRPPNDKLRFILGRLPVEINGEPTERRDVLSYKDLSRIETNRIRGGMCLTLCEGVALKSPKLYKRIRQYGKDYGLEDWEWLKEVKSRTKKGEQEKIEIKPISTYMKEIPAGRPVFSDPSAIGGFRVRYGRSRNTGLAGTGIHPATMIILDEFPAVCTQLRLERPGKACVVAPVDSIRGPVVLLKNGSLVDVRSEQQAKELLKEVEEILFVGDMLIATGEFSDKGHVLVPSAWCEEWWIRMLEEAKGEEVDKDPFKDIPSPKEAWSISLEHKIPLHPRYTYPYNQVSADQIRELAEWLFEGEVKMSGEEISGLELEKAPQKRLLELLWIPHELKNGRVILGWEALPLLKSLGYPDKSILDSKEDDALELVNSVSSVKIMKLAPSCIGARMGRPEKAERREMKGKPMVLFPVTRAGGRMRSVNCAAEKKTINTHMGVRECKSCGKRSYYIKCPYCGGKTRQRRVCRKCGKITDSDYHCGRLTSKSDRMDVKIGDLFKEACDKIGCTPELVKGVRGMSSDVKIPEHLEKGVLRAKHGLLVNKDGTIRFDSTDAPLTHIKPKEIGVSVEILHQLGYEKDVQGQPLTSDDQVLELFPQDILISDHPGSSCADWLIRVTKFVDELLVKFYGIEPYYEVESKEDLLGQLVIGLAPHTSAGVVGRVIGFTRSRAGFAHPIWHAGKRRNADGDEDSILLLMDAFLNFSRFFLPSSRGGRTMDAPLVLTTLLDPQEADNEVWAMDTCWKLPLEFYQATLEYADPDSVQIRRVSDQLEEPLGEGFTHPTTRFDAGPVVTAYTSLGPMLEKVEVQLELGRRLFAVDENREAEGIVSSHFLKDIKGNIRTFCRQSFRCTSCNKIYRRLPLLGRCECGGNIVLTVSQGSVEKYLEPSKVIAENFEVSDYMRQELRILEWRLKAMFGQEKEMQTDLSGFLDG